tara:strand:+ start:38 stop:1498 length:1461 start_codon:yes stop_codon:yes gene_type:complete
MATILGANTLATKGYQVQNSMMLDTGDDSYLSKTFSSAANSRTTFTVSAWFKKTANGITQSLVSAYRASDGFQTDVMRFKDDDTFQFYAHSANSSGVGQRTTNRIFRDVGAWYHIVTRVDTTQSTAGNRIRIYINGVEETSFSASSNMNQNGEIIWGIGSGVSHQIGAVGNSNHCSGYVAEVVYLDGQSLGPTSFGEFDPQTPTTWRPIDVTGLTYGNNSFYLEFKTPGDIGIDTSGNSNSFDGNNLQQKDQAQDTCTNNFCTWNVLNSQLANTTLTQGATKLVGGSQDSPNYTYIGATMAVTSGKWYWEAKTLDNAEIDQAGVSLAEISNFSQLSSSGGLQATTHGGRSVQFSNGNKAGAGAQSAHMGGFSANDYIMVALNMDDGEITFGRNGNWSEADGSSDAAFGSATAAFTDLETGQFYHPSHTMRDSAGNNSGSVAYNFGGAHNENFANSAETDGNGYGHFEYAPPSGYFALCSQNLAEYG